MIAGRIKLKKLPVSCAGYSLSILCLVWALGLEMGWVSSNPFSIPEVNKRLLAKAKAVPHPPIPNLPLIRPEIAGRTDVKLAGTPSRSSSARAINQTAPLERPRFSANAKRPHHTPPKFKVPTLAGLGRHPERDLYLLKFARTSHGFRRNRKRRFRQEMW